MTLHAVRANMRQIGILVLIAIVGVCASMLMFWVTKYGPGVSPDSVTYIEAARSALSGNGFFVGGKPMTHYPPGYPLLLAIAGLVQHGNLLQAGRLLDVFLFGVNLILFALAVYISTGQSLSATYCAMLVFLSSAPVISVHSMAWSEPPFITFSLSSFILLSLYIVRTTLYLLLAASLAAGSAIVTRYVGVTLLPPMVLSLLLFRDRPMRHGLKDAFLATTVASSPLALWLVRNIVKAHTLTDRTFAIHPIGLHHAMKALLLSVAAALVLIAFVILHRKSYKRRNANFVCFALPIICVMFLLTYILFLVISISFFDAHTSLNARILLPAFLALAVAVISLAWSLARALDKRFIWYSFVSLVLLSITISGIHAISEAVDINENGRGYTSRYWRSSETISYLANGNDIRRIYSNGPDVIQLLTEKEAIMIPQKISPRTRKVNQDYEKQLRRMFQECRQGEALIVYLRGITWRWYLPSIGELESKGNLPVLRRFADGVVYGRCFN